MKKKMNDVELEIIDRYRQYIQKILWTVIVISVIAFNFIQHPQFQNSRLELNFIVLLAAAYTFIYYRYIVPKLKAEIGLLGSTIVYTVLALAAISLTGGINSMMYGLIYGPILVSAMVFGGAKPLLIIVGIEFTWLFTEFFPIITDPMFSLTSDGTVIIEKFIAIVLVAGITYFNAKEIFQRRYEQQLLIEEKEKLQLLKEREETVFESIEDMIIALNEDGEVIMANLAFQKNVGLSRDEILGEGYTKLFDLIEVDRVGRTIEKKSLLELSEKDTQELETPNHDYKFISITSSTEKHIELKISPLVHRSKEGPQKTGIVVVMHDISQERELERMKLDFVSMAAHELRTPITAIRGYISTLKEESSQKLNPEERHFLDRSEIATQQLATLMENLLSVSKIERGTYNLDVHKTDWIALVAETVKEFVPRAKERGLQLKFHNPDTDIPYVMVDPLRIKEVLNNLLSNAITYTPEGSIDVRIEHKPQRGMVLTHVKDTGQGIPEDALPHMFEKFFRVSGALEQGSKGTGLGLYISKKIVELHKGDIWVESELGEGSTFTFSVPTVFKKN